MSYHGDLSLHYAQVRHRLSGQPIAGSGFGLVREGSECWRDREAALLSRIKQLEADKRALQGIVDKSLTHVQMPDRVTFSLLAMIVTDGEKVSVADLRGPYRHVAIVRARQIFCWIARYHFEPRRSYPQIGRYLGGRDHTSIMAACNRIDQLHLTDPGLVERLDSYVARLREYSTSE